ncbi:MAG: ATP-binding protein [Acidobacteriota bacterium]
MDKKLREDTLFSIDIESYLHKTAVFSQRSSLLYSTELVKTAFKRGADSVNITIDNNKVEIYDNGEGIDPSYLNMLAELKKTVPDERKEEAVRTLRGEYGAGLLAVFASAPKNIIIETLYKGKGYRLSISEEEILLEEGCTIPGGSRILLERKSREHEREINIFREHSRWSGKNIILNGIEIIPEKTIPDTLVSVKVGGEAPGLSGICGIPVSGMMCRIWMTENGVIRKKIDLPPSGGLIFSAVLETGTSEWEDVSSGLFPYVHKLYHYLCNNYNRVRTGQKDRIEELVFLHTKKTGERTFTNRIKPFRVSGRDSSIGLEELIKLSNSGKLYVVNSEYNKIDFAGKNSEFTIELKPRQIDFVLNHLRLAARIVDSTGISREGLLSKILIKFQDFKFMLSSGFKLFSRKVEEEDLWNEERALLLSLDNYFSHNAEIADKAGKVKFHILKGLGFSPLYIKTEDSGHLNSGLRIFLRRRSRIIRKITKLNDSDPINFELIKEFILSELKSGSVI